MLLFLHFGGHAEKEGARNKTLVLRYERRRNIKKVYFHINNFFRYFLIINAHFSHREFPFKKKGFCKQHCKLRALLARFILDELVNDGEVFVAESLCNHHTVDMMGEGAKRNGRIGGGSWRRENSIKAILSLRFDQIHLPTLEARPKSFVINAVENPPL